MRSALVIAGDIPYTIAAFTIILVAMVGTVAYWQFGKPRYDGLRVFVIVCIAAVVTIVALRQWGAAA